MVVPDAVFTMTRRTPNVTLVEREWLEMNPADAAARGMGDGDRARVKSRHGETLLAVRVTSRVAPGTVFTSFHFPESRANDLVGPTRDRLSDCPEYKVTAVEVERA